MLKNALSALGLIALAALASSAMFRQLQPPTAGTEAGACCVRPEFLVSFHEDFAASNVPVTRQLIPQIGGNGLIVTGITVSPTGAGSAPWSVDVLENATTKAGLSGAPSGSAPRPESVTFAHGIPIARGSGLSLRARADTGFGIRVTITGYVW